MFVEPFRSALEQVETLVRVLFRRSVSLLVALAACLGSQAHAAWPERPIQIVFPFAAGGIAADFVRVLAEELTRRLGQQVMIIEKPGAGGIVGFQMAKNAPPDGYTLVVGSNGPLTILPLLQKSVPYDPLKDFVPISQLVVADHIVVVSADSPIKSFADLREISRREPNKLTYASAGNGTTLHLAGAWFDSLNGSQMIHVPYKGGIPVLMAVISNEVSVSFGSMAAIPYLQAGKMRAIALLAEKRSPWAPDVPTAAEVGMPEMVVEAFYGLMAPRGTPEAITDRLRAEITDIMALPTTVQRLNNLQLRPASNFSGEYFASRVKGDLSRWKDVIEKNGIQGE